MKNVFIVFFFIIFFALQGVLFAGAEDLRIEFSGYSIEKETLSTYLSIKGDISYDTIDAIRNGITAKLYITFQLSKSGGFLGIGKSTYVEKIETFNLSYDVWENVFIVEERSRKFRQQVKKPSEIVECINGVINPLSLSLAPVKGDKNLYLRGKIRIQTIKLFPPFGIFMIFFDPWNYESGWVYTEIHRS